MAAYETHGGTATVNKDGTVTLTRTFRLDTGNAASRPAWAVAGIAINKYDPHPDDSTCLATDVSSGPVAGELGWFDLVYTYSNRVFDAGVSNTTGGEGGTGPGSLDKITQPDPTLRTPTVSWGSASRSKPFTRDWNPLGRRPVENSAGQPFEGLDVEDMTGTITVSFAKATMDVAVKQTAYLNKVNDANFSVVPTYTAYPAGTLRCNAWDGTIQYEPSYGWYTQCTVSFEYHPEGWVKTVLDAGFYTRFHDGTEYVNQKFVNKKTGMPVDSPQKLNGAGLKLEPNSTPVVADPYSVERAGQIDVSVYKTFYTHEQVSFVNIFA